MLAAWCRNGPSQPSGAQASTDGAAATVARPTLTVSRLGFSARSTGTDGAARTGAAARSAAGSRRSSATCGDAERLRGASGRAQPARARASARADAELSVDVAQVVLDRLRAEEHRRRGSVARAACRVVRPARGVVA